MAPGMVDPERVTVLAGTGNAPLAEGIAGALGLAPCPRTLDRFPDGELHLELHASVRGRDVYVVQPTAPPVDQNLVELLLTIDACRRAGADRVTAVIPYCGYARQDRRADARGPLSARVMADLLDTCGVSRVIALDLHSQAIEGFFRVPLEHLSAVPALAAAIRPLLPPGAVVVSPDLGGVPRAERFARLLDLPIAIVHKTRIDGAHVEAHGVVGNVEGRIPVLVDDMVATGGTIVAAWNLLRGAGCEERMFLVATHALLVGPAIDRLAHLPIDAFFATDSTAARNDSGGLRIERVSLVPLLAAAIARIARGEPAGAFVSAT